MQPKPQEAGAAAAAVNAWALPRACQCSCTLCRQTGCARQNWFGPEDAHTVYACLCLHSCRHHNSRGCHQSWDPLVTSSLLSQAGPGGGFGGAAVDIQLARRQRLWQLRRRRRGNRRGAAGQGGRSERSAVDRQLAQRQGHQQRRVSPRPSSAAGAAAAARGRLSHRPFRQWRRRQQQRRQRFQVAVAAGDFLPGERGGASQQAQLGAHQAGGHQKHLPPASCACCCALNPCASTHAMAKPT